MLCTCLDSFVVHNPLCLKKNRVSWRVLEPALLSSATPRQIRVCFENGNHRAGMAKATRRRADTFLGSYVKKTVKFGSRLILHIISGVRCTSPLTWTIHQSSHVHISFPSLESMGVSCRKPRDMQRDTMLVGLEPSGYVPTDNTDTI